MDCKLGLFFKGLLLFSMIFPSHAILAGGMSFYDFFLAETSTSAAVEDSFVGNQGIYMLNQSPGSLNNQGNFLLVPMGISGIAAVGLTANNNRNALTRAIFYSESEDLITNSFVNFRGIFMVNQSAGSLNDQVNALTCAVGLVSLHDQDLEREAPRADSPVILEEGRGIRKDIISGSFGGASGIGIVSQSSGYNNAIKNYLTVSFLTVVK